jgi:hypothetical protein
MIQEKCNVRRSSARKAAAKKSDVPIFLNIPMGLILLDTYPYPV